LNALGETRDPLVLVFGRCGKQQHITSTVWIMMQLARGKRIIAVNVVFMDFYSAPDGVKLLAVIFHSKFTKM
jgi:hypothetical protein